MGLFDFFKNKTETSLTPEQAIRRLVDYMPYFYNTDSRFKDCINFLEHHECKLAIHSLIELASESGHYFAEDFWLLLANAAKKMGMTKEAKFCRQQSKGNLRDTNFKTPFGWTTIKVNETHFQHHISEKLKDEWATVRRAEDKVLELIDQDGIHLKSHGRSGFIYFVDKGRVGEIYFELGMKGLITYFDNVKNWVIPTLTIVTIEEKEKLKQQLNDWSVKTKNVLDFY